jgi:Arc/MetJ-type ribon-helix-helix transcriptional regulator
MAKMVGKVVELRPKVPETEKITINLGHVDLGQIDLLVREGFYSNRTDLIRTAIRRELDRHGEAVKQSVARHSSTWACATTPERSSRRSRRRGDPPDPGAGPRRHWGGRFARTGARDDRLDPCAGVPFPRLQP